LLSPAQTSLYRKRGKEYCSAHFIREEVLEQIVLEEIQRVTKFALTKEREFAKIIQQKSDADSNGYHGCLLHIQCLLEC
jgi:site-specific DNA recombinase